MAKSKAHALIDELMKIHPKGYDLSLGRMTRILAKLDNPQDRLPPVIHVAGTNGKGSTIALCRAMLEADGKLVHVDTSPHLVNYHERFRIGAKGGGKLVDDEVLAAAIEEVAIANDGQPITVFEILTAATFLLFSSHPGDVALIEVGLGGRFDSTNVIKHSHISVITPVSLDHQGFLGDNIAQIAGEKAGIIKKNVPVIIAEQDEKAREVLEAAAHRLGSTAYIGGQDFACHEEAGRMVYQDGDGLLDLPPPALIGCHQLSNAATAIATLRYGGFDVSTAVIESGMRRVSWPGRLQRLKKGVLTGRVPQSTEIWIDGGHNPQAGEAIAGFMRQLKTKDDRPLVLVCGILTTKDPAGYFGHFSGLADRVIAVPVSSSDAGHAPAELAEVAKKAGLAAASAGSIEMAFDQLGGDPSAKRMRVLICGSLYLVGEVLKKNETPPE